LSVGVRTAAGGGAEVSACNISRYQKPATGVARHRQYHGNLLR
jgi:hypothetical protein